jgi:hypothetical protein
MTDLPTFRARLGEAVLAQPKPRWKAIEHRSGYGASHIHNLITGACHSPTLECVYALAEALDVTPAWLLGLDNV